MLVVGGLTVQAAEKPTSIKLCTDNVESYPWVVNGRDGLNVIHLKQVGQKLGIKIEISSIPWARCLDDMRQGTMDGAFSASFKQDRLAMGLYPGASDKPDMAKFLMMSGYSLYRLKENNVSYDGKTISNLTSAVGAQQGYSIVDQLKSMGVRVDDGTRGADDNLRKLLAGRLQVVALQTQEGDNSITQSEFSGKVEKMSPPLVEKPYFLMLSKQFYGKHTEFANEVWDTVVSVRESPEFKKAVSSFK
jgi:polar amino acid transport system substrate-binding protein